MMDGGEMDDHVGEDNGGVVVSPDFTALLTVTDKVVQNELILQNIFRFCETSSLASCRLVSKLWRSQSDHWWQRSVYYRLRRPFTFTDAMASFRNIKTESVKFVDDELRMFKVSVGSTLRSLYLFRHTFSSLDEFRHIIFRSCAQLEELKFSYCKLLSATTDTSQQHIKLATEENRKLVTFYWGFGDEQCPVTWYELFANFPMLTNFENKVHMLPAEENELYSAIRHVRDANNKNLPFKRFRLAGGLTVSGDPVCSHTSCAAVKELKLPVHNMSIMVTPGLFPELIIEMLNISSGTLKLLWLSTVALTNPPPSDLLANVPYGVKMDVLTCFVVCGNDLKSLSFLTYMPNLANLEIYEQPKDTPRYVTPTSLISNSTEDELAKLSSLKLLRLEYIVNGGHSQAMFSAMPNLEEVSMVFDFRQILTVCNSCPRLIRLHVLGEQLNSTQLAEIDRAVAVKRYGEYGSRINIETLTLLEILFILDVNPPRHAYWGDRRSRASNVYDY